MMTLKAASEAIGVSYRTVQNYHRRGLLPTVKAGQCALIDPTVLQAILNAAGYKPRERK